MVVVLITLATMVAEIVVGWLTNSMALLADGWHMGTHAFALGISLLAYVLARRHAEDRRFTFGTWKIEILGAHTSAVVLGVVGLAMAWASLERILNPLAIQYDNALIVAVLGLIVNLVCAVILDLRTGDHGDDHRVHPHPHGAHTHAHDHDDLNLKSAYLHVVADALTSLLAIGALLGAKHLAWNWLDPFMGIVGAGLVIRWAVLLLRETTGILLEVTPKENALLMDEIRAEIEADGDTRVSDLHLWKVAQDKYACIVSLVTGKPEAVEEYKARLGGIHELAHITVEMNACRYR